ncbi:MAG: hypothetical protein M0C28_42160 [Candidatus Moduliflexus flocculans]|nr:hypothetical protein [Candidatus Moduliflexus flocculans]
MVAGPRSRGPGAREGPSPRDRRPARAVAALARLLVPVRAGLGPERPDPGGRLGRLVHLRRRGLRLRPALGPAGGHVPRAWSCSRPSAIRPW